MTSLIVHYHCGHAEWLDRLLAEMTDLLLLRIDRLFLKGTNEDADHWTHLIQLLDQSQVAARTLAIGISADSQLNTNSYEVIDALFRASVSTLGVWIPPPRGSAWDPTGTERRPFSRPLCAVIRLLFNGRGPSSLN